MNKIAFIFSLLIAGRLTGQNIDSLTAKIKIDCSEISYKSSLLYKAFIEHNEIDSAKILLKYWESKCGITEPIYRAKVILSIKEGNYREPLPAGGALNMIFNYQNRMALVKKTNLNTYNANKSEYGYIPPGEEFDVFTQREAASLKGKCDPGTIEYMLSEFYSSKCDTILTKLQTSAFKKTSMAIEYRSLVEKYLKIPETNVALVSGLWIPTGDLKKIGSHPELGIQGGIKLRKMNYDVIMLFRFGNSPNNYYARRTKLSDPMELTNYFFSGQIGIDIGRDIYVRNGHEIQLTGGISIDGFEAFEEGPSIWSYNFSFGPGYRYYITNSLYIGLRTKYNIIDYTLNNIVDFTGNPITIQLIIGNVNNQYRNHFLKTLKYKLRGTFKEKSELPRILRW
jgi:hypothetical protein